MTNKGELKLFYFKLRGRGEPIRLALESAGVEYVDTALADGIDFASMKVRRRSLLAWTLDSPFLT